MQYFKATFIFVFALLTASSLWAQQPNLDQEIVTVGERELKLKDAFKKNFYPTEVDTIIKKDDLTYQLIPLFYKTTFETDTIKAARLKVVEPLTKLYPGYVKLGIGNYLSPLAEFYYGSKRNRNGLFAVKLRHFSSRGEEDLTKGFAGPFAQTNLDFWVKRFQKRTAFSAQIFGERNAREFNTIYNNLPITPDLVFSAETQRVFYKAGTHLKLESYNNKKEKLDHLEEIKVSYLGDNLSTSELNIKAGTTLEKFYGTELYKLNFNIEQNMYQLQDSAYKQNNTLINLHPQIFTSTKKIKADIGVRVTSFIEKGRNYFYVIPNASLTYTGAENYISPYIGIGGDAKMNTFHSLIAQNPFYNAIQTITIQRELYNFYAGLRGRMGQKASFNLKVSKNEITNLPTYQERAHTGIDNVLDFVISETNINKLSLLGELSFQLREQLLWTVSATYNSYYGAEPLINAPIIELASHINYNLGDKLIGKLDVTYVPERTGSRITSANSTKENPEYETVNLGSYVDLSLGLEYRYTRRFSAFINLANMTGNRYLIYPKYNVLGFSILGGVTYSF